MNDTIHLCRAVSGDAAAIITVHRAAVRGTASHYYDSAIIDEWASCDPPAERESSLAARLSSGEEMIVLAKTAEGEIVGFGSLAPKDSELRAIYVDPSFGRKGVGRRLINAIEDLAYEIGLSKLKLDASLNAEAFYKANGYREEKRGEHILQSGRRMACVHMAKKLSSLRA